MNKTQRQSEAVFLTKASITIKKYRNQGEKVLAVILLIIMWQLAAHLINEELLLPSPFAVIKRTAELITEKGFFSCVFYTSTRILLGFAVSLISGCLLAFAGGAFHLIEILLRPFMLTIKSVPVASFIIIVLIWFASGSVSVFISALIVLPVVYNNVLSGIKNSDPKMKEMADVFRLGVFTRFKFIWFPAVKNNLLAASETGAGMAWKAGIAAELIGIPTGSLGEKLYLSKVYFDSLELLSWTVVIVLLSVLSEKIIVKAVKLCYRFLFGKR